MLYQFVSFEKRIVCSVVCKPDYYADNQTEEIGVDYYALHLRHTFISK